MDGTEPERMTLAANKRVQRCSQMCGTQLAGQNANRMRIEGVLGRSWCLGAKATPRLVARSSGIDRRVYRPRLITCWRRNDPRMMHNTVQWLSVQVEWHLEQNYNTYLSSG